jgi:16S rRNA (uracil1498-N3)-methyltransferase
MRVELMDGLGSVWSGVIEQIHPERVELGKIVLISGDEGKEVRIDLILALCKNDRLEWILEKATEIGVANIYLLNAERSVAKLPADRLQGRIDRWQKIMNAASKQSRRLTLPHLYPPFTFESLLHCVTTDLKLVFTEKGDTPSLKTLLKERAWESASLGIGPEGGWTSREEKLFCEAGFLPANLGHNILRSETAAIVASSILRYELGE